MTPYCHCKEPLKVKHYIIGAITPAIFLGFIPSVLAIVIGNIGILIFGVFFTMAACGDFLVINLIRRGNKDDLVQDHPSEAGCFIYRKDKTNIILYDISYAWFIFILSLILTKEYFTYIWNLFYII